MTTFEDWLGESLPSLLRYARGLWGSDRAETVVHDVAITMHADWRPTESQDHHDAHARQLINHRYLSWRRSRSRSGSQVGDPHGLTQGTSDDDQRRTEQRKIAADLERLPRRQRAVVVLGYLEGLSVADSASLLNWPESTVSRRLDQALAALRIEATPTGIDDADDDYDHRGRTEGDLRGCLNALADKEVDIEALIDRVNAQLESRRKNPRRTGAVLALATATVVAAVALPQVLGPRVVPPDKARVPGNWNLVHRVKNPPNGWVTVAAAIEPETETTWLGAPGSLLESGRGCAIEITAAGEGDVSLRGVAGQPLTVNGHPGFYSDENSVNRGGVSWSYSADAWANVSCRGPDDGLDRELSIDVAERVQFKPTVSKLPFSLSQVPDGYRVAGVAPHLAESSNFLTGLLLVSDEGYIDSLIVSLSRADGYDQEEPTPTDWKPETVNGFPAKWSEDAGLLILDVRGSLVYLEAGGDSSAQDSDAAGSLQLRELLIETAGKLILADDFSDQDTWFEMNETLPS